MPGIGEELQLSAPGLLVPTPPAHLVMSCGPTACITWHVRSLEMMVANQFLGMMPVFKLAPKLTLGHLRGKTQ
ncbi:hypothetical protein BaRGS_00011781 [Batillaria attramentaria]|uniref:Uncharacterized protein n=1 Tax=Batillaria attramentaria TaxID=370345 RepID=A0ABD0LCD4_9CAEN